MIKRFCDICGEEYSLGDVEGIYGLKFRIYKALSDTDEASYSDISDICPECPSKIAQLIDIYIESKKGATG